VALVLPLSFLQGKQQGNLCLWGYKNKLWTKITENWPKLNIRTPTIRLHKKLILLTSNIHTYFNVK